MGCKQIVNKTNNNNNNKNQNTQKINKLIEINIKEFCEEALKQHNKLREMHHANNLKIDDNLQNYAQKFAEEIANKSEEYHSQCLLDGKVIGENIYIDDNFITGEKMTNEFYNEYKNYDFNKAECEIKALRFTQLIWKNSKEVGFGIAKSKSGKFYCVANYYPPGNLLGEYKENVQEK